MLSLSMKVKDQAVDLQLINGELCEAGGGVKFGNELMKFAEAVASRDASALMLSRDRLWEVAGADVVVDAAAVAANFQRMVRIADSTGIPLDESNVAFTADIRERLDLGRFQSAHNSGLGN